MNHHALSNSIRSATLCGAVILLAAGCNKKQDNSVNFTRAIDTYYSAHPACLWSEHVKFPVQRQAGCAL
jgi:hypothetical protein